MNDGRLLLRIEIREAGRWQLHEVESNWAKI
jgi:hypothetical protein